MIQDLELIKCLEGVYVLVTKFYVKFGMGIKIAASNLHFFLVGTGPAPGQSRGGGGGRCLYIDGDDRGSGLVLADTGEVKDDKEKKDFNIETIMDEFLAVITMETVSMGLAVVMCKVVI